MTVLGNLVVALALVASAVATVLYVRAATKGNGLVKMARMWVRLALLAVVAASVVLMVLLFSHDFTNGYVYSYSSTDLPLHFLVSSFYAGQEGSFLFWILCSTVLSIILMRSTAARKTEPWVMAVFMGVQTALLFLLLAKTPFYFIWDKFSNITAGTVPAEGSGLNPLLQNFWMMSHPPVLFIGFATLAIPFSFAIASLWRKKYSLLADHGLTWVGVSSLVLGAGIMLGAYWAYGVLGWGGYWGWDPVENSSLVPWLTSVALIHTMLAQRRTNRFVKTNYVLAIVSFLLVIYSTFLTRSGILGDSSVHAFVDAGAAVYWLLMGLMIGIVALGGGLMYLRRGDLTPGEGESSLISRETGLAAGAISLSLSAAVILFGTTLPIFSASTVDPAFYDTTNLPLAIVLTFLIGVSLYMQWRTGDGREVLMHSLKPLIGAVVVSVGLYFAGMTDLVMLLLAFTSLFALFANVESGVKTMAGGLRVLGGKLAHIGLALFLIGVITTGKYSSTSHVELPYQLPKEVLGYSVTYVGYTPTEDGKFAFHVNVERDGRTFRMSPVMFDGGRQGIMRNPDIASFLTKDFYISPVSLDQPHAEADREHSMETYTIQKGGTVSIGDVKAKFVGFEMDQHGGDAVAGSHEGMTVGSVLELTNGLSRETVTPVAFYSMAGQPEYRPQQSQLIGATIQLVSMNVGMNGGASTVTVGVNRGDSHVHQPETLVVEASIKPFVNLLWAGTAVMLVGFVLSVIRRTKE